MQQYMYISHFLHITRTRNNTYNRYFNINLVALGFKDKTRYTPYVSPGSKISHIATNKGNINRQCIIYNILSIKDITLDSKQWKRQLGSSSEDSNSTETTDWLITSLIPPNSSKLVPIQDFSKDLKSKASVSTCRTQQI